MARKKKSHENDVENTKPRQAGGLQPYSGHVAGHKYVIYATYAREGEKVGRILVMKFLGTFAAKRMVLTLINKDEYTWDVLRGQHARITTERGVDIHAHGQQLKEIMEHEFTAEEDEWRDPALTGHCNRFLFARDAGAVSDVEHLPVHSPIRKSGGNTDGTTDSDRSDVRPDVPVKKPKREPVSRTPRVDTSGLVTANDIAKALGVEGRDVRGVLRGAAFTKPDHGNWAWPKKEAEGIKEQIAKELKKLAKKKGKK